MGARGVVSLNAIVNQGCQDVYSSWNGLTVESHTHAQLNFLTMNSEAIVCATISVIKYDISTDWITHARSLLAGRSPQNRANTNIKRVIDIQSRTLFRSAAA